MQMCLSRNWSLLGIAVTSVAAFALAAGCHAQQPAPPAAASAIPLQLYTAPDQSASAGVPSGWQVTKGGETVITMTGPQGETVTLGNTVTAQNAAFQPGQRGSNGIDLSMPYSATLPQKLTMIIQQNAAISGKPAPPLTINSATPIPLPAALGQCGRFVASISGAQGQMKVMAAFCSLPMDPSGAYKNIMLYAQAPAAVAAQSAPIAQAIFKSYQVPAAWMQKKLAPHFVPPPAMAGPGPVANPTAVGNAINGVTIRGIQGTNNMTNCVSLALRDTPDWDTPRSCGGSKPDYIDR